MADNNNGSATTVLITVVIVIIIGAAFYFGLIRGNSDTDQGSLDVNVTLPTGSEEEGGAAQ